MGSGIPMLTAREVVGILQALGFVLIRQKGSHQQFRHPDGRGTTAVSYTHLDVYKRQRLASALCS